MYDAARPIWDKLTRMTMKRELVFAYGSLLCPRSLRRTLPDVEIASCIPARASGYVRSWSVAFPNDGSQPDKSYRSDDGSKPDVVLFVDLETSDGSAARTAANGVLIPMERDRINRLADRERRYEREDVSPAIAVYPAFEDRMRGFEPRVTAFVGRPEFTRPEDVRRGVVSREYRDSLDEGVAFWDRRVEGFEADFAASTVRRPDRVVDLVRIDRS